MDAAESICPDCPTVLHARHESINTRPFSRLPATAATAAAAARTDPPALKMGGSGAVGGPKALGKERSADGRRLGKAGGKDLHPRRSSQGWPSPGTAPASEKDKTDGGRKSASLTPPSTVADDSKSKHEGARDESGGSGRAATVSDSQKRRGGDLHEGRRGGMGGALQWLKDRVSDTVTSGHRNGERGVMEWDGMD